MDEKEKVKRIRLLNRIEIRIVYQICQGMASSDLAFRDDLGFKNVSSKTIVNHLTNIYKKLGIIGGKGKENKLIPEYCGTINKLLTSIEEVNKWVFESYDVDEVSSDVTNEKENVPSTGEENVPIPAPPLFLPKSQISSEESPVVNEPAQTPEILKHHNEPPSAVPNQDSQKSNQDPSVNHPHRSLENRISDWVSNVARRRWVQWISGLGVITLVFIVAFNWGRRTGFPPPTPTGDVAAILSATPAQQAVAPGQNPTQTPQPTSTNLPAVTITPSLTPTITQTPTPSNTPTDTSTFTSTPTTTNTPSPTPTPLFFEDFSYGIPDTIRINYPDQVDWQNGRIHLKGRVIISFGSPDWTDYRVSFDEEGYTCTSINWPYFGVRAQDDYNYIGLQYRYGGIVAVTVVNNQPQSKELKAGGVSCDPKTTFWFNAQGNKFWGMGVDEFIDNNYPKGYVVIQFYEGPWLDNFKVEALPPPPIP